jgi:hypothetical protein
VAAVLAAGALAAGLATAGPAQAGTARPRGHDARCKPAIKVLDSLPGSWGSPDRYVLDIIKDNGVNDFGTHGLAVGASHGLPVYWTGARVHRVPLPAGYDAGSVAAVNRHGLMVGAVRNTATRASAAFSYRTGAPAVRLLPGGAYAADVNDHGHIVGAASPTGYTDGLEWVGTHLRRHLPTPDGYRVTEVTGINNSGRISGSAEGTTGDPDYLWWTAGLAWPSSATAAPDVLQPIHPGDTYQYWSAKAIDDSARIVGTSTYSRIDYTTPVQWQPPYGSDLTPGTLGDRTNGSLDDISATTDVSVGTASDSFILGPFPPDTAPPVQAQIWPGSGPVLALPRLSPGGYSAGNAVSDDGRAGGTAADAAGTPHPVVWTCALKQAYPPPASG